MVRLPSLAERTSKLEPSSLAFRAIESQFTCWAKRAANSIVSAIWRRSGGVVTMMGSGLVVMVVAPDYSASTASAHSGYASARLASFSA
jgi:hypothetical protein